MEKLYMKKQKNKNEINTKPLTPEEIKKNQGLFKTKGKLMKALMREKKRE